MFGEVASVEDNDICMLLSFFLEGGTKQASRLTPCWCPNPTSQVWRSRVAILFVILLGVGNPVNDHKTSRKARFQAILYLFPWNTTAKDSWFPLEPILGQNHQFQKLSKARECGLHIGWWYFPVYMFKNFTNLASI